MTMSVAKRVDRELIHSAIRGQALSVLLTCGVGGALCAAFAMVRATSGPALAAVCLAIIGTAVLPLALSGAHAPAPGDPASTPPSTWVFAAAATAAGLALG